MIRFKLADHSARPGQQMVEVWVGDQFVGAIYPGDRDDELRFVSKHLMAANLIETPFPPAVQFFLNLDGSRQ